MQQKITLKNHFPSVKRDWYILTDEIISHIPYMFPTVQANMSMKNGPAKLTLAETNPSDSVLGKSQFIFKNCKAYSLGYLSQSSSPSDQKSIKK
jgi:hypothetical protein